MKKKDLRIFLESISLEFSQRELVKTDPIRYVYKYSDQTDQEIVAFISSLFAYGNVAAIFKGIESVIANLGEHPSQSILQLHPDQIRKRLKSAYYRFYRSEDIVQLILAIRHCLINEKSLGESFKTAWTGDVCKSLYAFNQKLKQNIKINSVGLKYMFPNPLNGVAKRNHMFLRWMARKDEIDLGLWNFISPSKLLIPLDTHLFDISKRLGLTKRLSASRNAVLEITGKLRELNPNDPLKYDFALCRLGILKLKNSYLSF